MLEIIKIKVIKFIKMEISSFFDEQQKRLRQTWLLLFLGVIWMLIMGFLVVFVNVTFLHFLENELHEKILPTINLQNAFFWGMVLAVLLWILIVIFLKFRSYSFFPLLAGGKKADYANPKIRFLRDIIEEVVIAAGEGKEMLPSLYIIETNEMNAFACGRSIKKGSIAVTTGLLDRLNRDELQAVIGHEIAHLKNRDAIFTTHAIGFVYSLILTGAAVSIVSFVIFAIFSLIMMLFMKIGESSEDAVGCIFSILGIIIFIYGIIVSGIYILTALIALIIVSIGVKAASCSISSAREYLADACSAQWTRNPLALAEALAKITSHPSIKGFNKLLLRPLWFNGQQLNANSLSARIVDFLYQTHPSTESRIERLKAMAGSTIMTDGQWLIDIKVSFWSKLKHVLSIFTATALAAGITFGIWNFYKQNLWSDLNPQVKSAATVTPQKIFGRINKPKVNVREGPGLNYRVMFQLNEGTVVEIKDSKVDWYYIEFRTSSGIKTGWVAKSLIALSNRENNNYYQK